ncbi:MAG TPA: hypothetical protein VGJ60_15700 [Chloroflexota bacterium]
MLDRTQRLLEHLERMLPRALGVSTWASVGLQVGQVQRLAGSAQGPLVVVGGSRAAWSWDTPRGVADGVATGAALEHVAQTAPTVLENVAHGTSHERVGDSAILPNVTPAAPRRVQVHTLPTRRATSETVVPPVVRVARPLVQLAAPTLMPARPVKVQSAATPRPPARLSAPQSPPPPLQPLEPPAALAPRRPRSELQRSRAPQSITLLEQRVADGVARLDKEDTPTPITWDTPAASEAPATSPAMSAKPEDIAALGRLEELMEAVLRDDVRRHGILA